MTYCSPGNTNETKRLITGIILICKLRVGEILEMVTVQRHIRTRNDAQGRCTLVSVCKGRVTLVLDEYCRWGDIHETP